MKQKLSLLFLVTVVIAAIFGCVTTPESGRRAFILTTEEEENRLGEQAFREVLTKEKRSSNARWNSILQRVGQRIAAAANRPDYKWEFALIESPEKNAFCLPGGKVAFYTGIFPALKNEAGLAAVMGHEVAHATARHGGQRISTSIVAQQGLGALSALLGGGPSQGKDILMAALGAGTQVGVLLPFSRDNESEADAIGIKYMARAGYDPREAARFWDRFAKETGSGGPKFLSTHPPSSERKQDLESRVPQVLPEYERSPKFGIGENL